VESISQLWNLFHQVRNEGTFFITLEFISPGNLQEQIIRKMSYTFVIKGSDLFYLEKDKLSDNMVKKLVITKDKLSTVLKMWDPFLFTIVFNSENKQE
jgi:hypothetical protein